MLIGFEGDPLAFAHRGSRFMAGDPDGSAGYDGQFFYFIARDGAAAVPLIDGPSLRYMRILYPLAARLLALGQAALVPWTLIAVNVLALAAGAGLLAYLLVRRGAPPAYGLVYAVWIGALLALRLDLSELLCFALALAAVAAYDHQRTGWAVLWLVLAALTKELGLVIAVGLALHAALGRARWRQALALLLLPHVAFLLWVLLLRLWLGRLPLGYPAARLDLPLYGWFTIQEPMHQLFAGLWLALPALALSLAALWRTARTRQLTLGAALLLVGAGFTLVMPDLTWQDFVAACRVGLPLIVTGLLFLGEHYPRALPWAAAWWVPATLVLFMVPGLLGF